MLIFKRFWYNLKIINELSIFPMNLEGVERPTGRKIPISRFKTGKKDTIAVYIKNKTSVITGALWCLSWDENWSNSFTLKETQNNCMKRILTRHLFWRIWRFVESFDTLTARLCQNHLCRRYAWKFLSMIIEQNNVESKIKLIFPEGTGRDSENQGILIGLVCTSPPRLLRECIETSAMDILKMSA